MIHQELVSPEISVAIATACLGLYLPLKMAIDWLSNGGDWF